MTMLRRFFLFGTLAALFVIGTSVILAQDQPNAWSIFDPHDPGRPVAIIPDASAFRLDPQWQVGSIEYLDQWWGLGEPVFDYQTIRHDGSAYHNGKVSVDPAKVEAFLDSLRHLHPTQFLLSGIGGTDNYPSWTVELNGADGQSVLLFSTSTANPDSAPWNVLINGRMYAQYDGSLAAPLNVLFSGEAGRPVASMSFGQPIPGTVIFRTEGWPNQLTFGFSGLLPIADKLQYQARLDSATVEGSILGRSSIGGFGHMIIGTITDLKAVTLSVEDHSIACSITATTADDPAHAGWIFSCPVTDAKSGAFYRYPLSVEFGTDSGETGSSTGVLTGQWGGTPDLLAIPADEQLQAAMNADTDASDLLTDHRFAFANYQAQIDPDDPQSGAASGEAILVGTTEVEGQPIRYSIGTPFILRDGAFTQWDLSRAKLDALLTTVRKTALTQRAAQAEPHLLINLWYAEAVDVSVPDVPVLDQLSVGYGASLASCGTKETTDFPSETEPLQAFSFNSRMDYHFPQPEFVLVNGHPQLSTLMLFPLSDAANPLISVLLPDALNTGDHMPFARVWLSNTGGYYFGNGLQLDPDDQANLADLSAYRDMAQVVSGNSTPAGRYFKEIDNLTFTVTDEGKINIATCPT